MKKMFILFAVAALGLSLSSCKKDYTCTCTDDQGNVVSETQYEGLKGDEKDAAEAACALSSLGGFNCSLSED